MRSSLDNSNPSPLGTIIYPKNFIDTPDQADWTKQTWDLPPYKSEAFYAAIGGEDQLEHFKTLPVYKYARAKGVIDHNDKWVDAAVTGLPAKSGGSTTRGESIGPVEIDTFATPPAKLALSECYSKSLAMIKRGSSPDLSSFESFNRLPEPLQKDLAHRLENCFTVTELLAIFSEAAKQLSADGHVSV